jgi:nucleotide-binding universal stress UspA family protein
MNSSIQRAADPVYNTVLVPLDGSRLADGALPTARALATQFGATVHTVTVASTDLERQRIRRQAAHALGTDPDDARIHVEVHTDVAVFGSGAADIIHTSTAPALEGPWAINGGWEYTAVLATVGAAIALTGPGKISVDHALCLDWSAAGSVGGVALGVAAALATLLLRRPAPAQSGAASKEGEPLCTTA